MSYDKIKKIPLGIKHEYNLDRIEEHKPRKCVFSKNIMLTIENHFGGYHLVFSSKKGDLSAIFHQNSYGSEDGLWEIMPPKPPKSWGDSVRGYMTFQQVLKWVNKLL